MDNTEDLFNLIIRSWRSGRIGSEKLVDAIMSLYGTSDKIVDSSTFDDVDWCAKMRTLPPSLVYSRVFPIEYIQLAINLDDEDFSELLDELKPLGGDIKELTMLEGLHLLGRHKVPRYGTVFGLKQLMALEHLYAEDDNAEYLVVKDKRDPVDYIRMTSAEAYAHLFDNGVKIIVRNFPEATRTFNGV